MNIFRQWLVGLFVFGLFSSLLQGEVEGIPIGEAPMSHIWDYDDVFRNDPKMMKVISKSLIALEEDHEMEVYLVLYSALVGEKPYQLSQRCHAKWLGDDNDGLVLAISLNGGTAGVIGYSRPLYGGEYLDSGLMPRVPAIDLKAILEESSEPLEKMDDQIEQVSVCALSFSDKLRSYLEVLAKPEKGGGSLQFMGWMILVLMGCGGAIGLLALFLGSSERRAGETFFFPDFTVAQRLSAGNGGGKISVIDFGSPPLSSDGR